MYYNMDGKQVSVEEWSDLYAGPDGKRVIQQTDLPGGVWVSTVLIGIDMSMSMQKHHVPIIFETMVFESKTNMADVDCHRYSTKQQAEDGHDRTVTIWTGWTPGDPYPEGVGY